MLSKRMLLLFVVAAQLITACESKPPPEDKFLDRLVQDSTYIFSGTLEKRGAAYTSGVPVNANTAIVKVEHVYTPSDILGDLTNQQVTVQLQPDTAMEAGDKAVFFTDGWIYGKGVAFMEVARMNDEQPDQFTPRIAASLQRKADQELKSRLERASLIVVAKVVKTDDLKLEKPLPISEHNPQWRQATLEVTATLRGETRGQELQLIYPASGDEAWIDSPKPKANEQGIWILQKDQQEKGGAKFRVPGYTALDALDFQPMDQLDRVKRLTGKQ